MDASEIRAQISEYYSKVTVEQSGEMATHTCSCGPDSLPPYMRMIARQLPDEITSRFYGCGSPLPPALEGCTIVDLGCGTGRDVYLASKLAGPKGKVIGIDMNADQLAVAERYHAQMAEEWGFDNIEFRQGFIEDLEGIADESVDVVISNCVINLSPMKERVFQEIWRVLKNGGELYFSDIFADRRMPEELSQNPLLLGECLGGALYIEDFRRMMARIGWENLRYMSFVPVAIDNPEVEELVGDVRFVSTTVRAIKLPELIEDTCEIYGQKVTYLGGMLGMEEGFVLDRTHTYLRDQQKSACGNPAAILGNTRYGAYFDIEGDRSHHGGACCGGVFKDVNWDDTCCDSGGGSGSGSGSGGSDCCSSSSTKKASSNSGSGSSCCSSGDSGSSSSSSCCSPSSSSGSGSSCCSDDDCCCDDENGCCTPGADADDPNMGHKEVVVVDYLYLDLSVCDRCQGTDERVARAVEQLRPIMDAAGYNIVMNKVLIEDERIAERFEFVSSPTVRVNGVDICPEVLENECDCCRSISDYDVYCRQFDFNGKLYEVPPVAYIEKRLLEIVFQGERPTYDDYVMPENIRGFLRGKIEKQAKKASAGKSSCC